MSPASSDNIVTVGLLWHSSNSANLGIGALTVSNIAIIEKVADRLGLSVRFKIFQWQDPERDYVNRENVEIIRLRAKHFLLHPAFLKHIRKCNFVLDISAGDSFADIYGAKRFILNACSKLSTLIARRKLILPPQTIGPFQRGWSRFVAGLLMKASSTVLTRDDLSTKYVKQFNLGDNLIEATDVAFVLPYDPPSKTNATGTIQVGINVSGLLFNGGYTGQNMFGLKADYPETIRSLIKQFQQLENCQVHLVAHVVPQNLPVENDLLVATKLGDEFPGVVVAPQFENPTAAKNYISGMDFFCGSRMHACIAAFSSGVPVLPLAYSRKFAGVFGTIDYRWGADLKTMSASEVVETTMSAFKQRTELLADVKKGMSIATTKLGAYEKVLEETMQQQIKAAARD